jgi:DNA polymerase-3 subunit gamma/tau
VVGQEPVVRTLRNAVEREKVHHAYLFVGSRGTGKTSMAKILASCLNCERGPTIDPCGQCDSCRSIAQATSLDVIEMDAASNNSVDDIRELRESVVFAPVSGRHKVYILDEAHMLSQAAWNAFLKTLEEPPPNTVFVLATTEAGKVPATVVDRCHRFDFHRPTVEQIASVVMRAAAAESIEIPPEAVAAVARSATGSFRDALGTLEQLVTYSGSQIVLADVLAVLGVADEQLLSDAFEAVQGGDARGALLTVARCVEGGRDAGSFIRDLEGRARELLVVQTLGDVPPELSLTPEIDERLRAQAQRIGASEVVRALDLLGAALEGVRAGADPRTQLELALVKAATPQADGSTRALLARIERLEHVLAGASTPTASAATPSATPAAAAGHHLAPATPASPPSAQTPSQPPPGSSEGPGQTQAVEGSEADPLATPVAVVAAAREPIAPSPGEPLAASPSMSTHETPATALAAPAGESVTPAREFSAEAGVPAGEPVVTSPGSATAVPPAHELPPTPEQESVAAPPITSAQEPAATPSTIEAQAPVAAPVALASLPVSEDLGALWPAAHESVRAEHGLLGAVLSEATPAILTEEELTLAFPPTAAFHKRKAEDPANRATLIETLQRLTGRRYRVSFELRDDLPAQEGGGAGAPSEEEIMARLVAELDAEELPEDWLQQRKGGE